MKRMIDTDTVVMPQPPGWSSKPFSELVQKIGLTEKKVKESDYLLTGKYPVIDQGQQLISGFSNDNDKALFPDRPWVIFGDHTRQVKYFEKPFIAGADGVKILTPNSGIDSRFLYWLVQYIAYLIPDKGYARHFQYVDKAIVTFPSDEHSQKVIAQKIDRLFSEIDVGFEELKKAKANLDLYKQSVLSAAIQGKLVPQDPSDEPASGLLERIRLEKEKLISASKLKRERTIPPVDPAEVPFDLPRGWEWVRIGSLGAAEAYSLAIGPFGSNLKVSDYREEGVPLVFVRNIRSECFGGTNTKFVTVRKAKELFAHSIKGGDVLITKMGEPPGDACVYPLNQPSAIITADCIKIRPHNIVSADYLSFAINSPVAKPQIREFTQGVAQKKVSLERFKNLLLPLPGRGTQERIVLEVRKTIQSIEMTKNEVTDKEKRVDLLKQSVLKSAFEGTLI